MRDLAGGIEAPDGRDRQASCARIELNGILAVDPGAQASSRDGRETSWRVIRNDSTTLRAGRRRSRVASEDAFGPCEAPSAIGVLGLGAVPPHYEQRPAGAVIGDGDAFEDVGGRPCAVGWCNWGPLAGIPAGVATLQSVAAQRCRYWGSATIG